MPTHLNSIRGGGGSLPSEAVPDAREKKRGKGVSKSGVGAERADPKKGVNIANWKKGIKKRYD